MQQVFDFLREPDIQKLLFALVGGAIGFVGSLGLDSLRSRRDARRPRDALRADLEVLHEALKALRVGQSVGSTNALLQLERVCGLYAEDREVLKAIDARETLRSLCRALAEARALLKGLRSREGNPSFDPGSPDVLIGLVKTTLEGLR